jgi:DNA-binding XRE family transcriptional regulator
MNLIERMRDELAGRFPDLRFDIDAPMLETGNWHLDVRRGDGTLFLVAEWRPARGIGVSVLRPDEMNYGLGPDEVYTDTSQAKERIIHLIESGEPTVRPSEVRLAELRQSRGLSQAELAERVGVKQANISRIEGRDDLKVSTLVKVVEAMGATLSIRARFPDGTEQELEF